MFRLVPSGRSIRWSRFVLKVCLILFGLCDPIQELEDTVLSRISAANADFLGDTALVDSLEVTKITAAEIELKSKEAAETSKHLDEIRERYRPVAQRASLLFFLLNDLQKIHPMYQVRV